MRIATFFAGLLLLSGLAGCATPTMTAEENNARILATWDLELHEIADDTNMVMMYDRPSRLTRWTTR